MANLHKLLIKNMVCERCVMTVGHILTGANIPFRRLLIGEVELERKLGEEETQRLRAELSKVGFEIIETRLHKTIQDIKLAILDYLTLPPAERNKNLSAPHAHHH